MLAGIAEELGSPLGFRTVAEARARWRVRRWDGERLPARDDAPDGPAGAATRGKDLALATWKQMLDNGSLQDGDKHLGATARTPVARVFPATFRRGRTDCHRDR